MSIDRLKLEHSKTQNHIEFVRNNLWRTSPARMAEHLDPNYKRYPYIKYIDDIITSAILRGGARIVLSMPPRHGKSLLISKNTPAWFLSQFPDKNVILASYEATFASHWGKNTRNFLQENETKLGVKLAQDSLASDRWNTVDGGGMFTTGIGGPITGRGAQLIVIDDPIKNWEEARSETIRQNHIDWFNSTLYTRCEPGASIIILMTRWHEMDLAGYLLSEHKDKWQEIRLPAFAEDGDTLGRKNGAALCPERFDERALAQIKESLGPNMWASLYQQRPVPLEGDLFKTGMFVKFPIEPNAVFDYKFATVDTAYTDKTSNDFTCAVVFGVRNDQLWIVDVFRQRIKASDVEVPLVTFLKRHTQYGFRGVYIEPKGHGIYLNQVMPKYGILVPSESQLKDFYKDRVSDKVIRANNAVPHVSNRRIVFNDSVTCADDCIAEALGFPKGRHDDFVDCLIDGIKFAFSTANLKSICDVLFNDVERKQVNAGQDKAGISLLPPYFRQFFR